jgi:hypothetical protein
MDAAGGTLDRRGNFAQRQPTPDPHHNYLALDRLQALQRFGDRQRVKTADRCRAADLKSLLSCALLTLASASSATSRVERPVLHHAKQPRPHVFRHNALPREFHERFLHAVVGRVGPLGRVQRERRPMLVQQPAE